MKKMKKLFLPFLMLVAMTYSCNQQGEVSELKESSRKIEKVNYVYNNEVLSVSYEVDAQGNSVLIEDESAAAIREIYASNPELNEVNGLDFTGNVYLFDNDYEHLKFLKSSEEGKSILAEIEKRESAIADYSSYSTAYLKLYEDSYYGKEIDWTSSCFYRGGTEGNFQRLTNMSNHSSQNSKWWQPRNSAYRCNGGKNVNDRLSSFKFNTAKIGTVILYKDRNYRGSKKYFYRNIPPHESRYSFVGTWIVVPRLESWSRWNDRVSSIKAY
ncbi:hypothetical protein [uncultured Zobellia sp.]|uniref:hypothetical protein n=1 Tax=uncultured Zobellia sp. TaxID=255433 RepID=UPI002599DD9F|nr:hypothetical protein [uncultured Zobellia sp.]